MALCIGISSKKMMIYNYSPSSPLEADHQSLFRELDVEVKESLECHPVVVGGDHICIQSLEETQDVSLGNDVPTYDGCSKRCSKNIYDFFQSKSGSVCKLGPGGFQSLLGQGERLWKVVWHRSWL